MKIAKIIIINLFFLTIMSCSENKLDLYAKNKPKLDIRNYLNGKIKAWGVLENRSGVITRRFEVDMVGSWNKNEGVLKEEFLFDDGKKEKRVWKIKFSDDNNFTASASDVINIAKGRQIGNAMRMNYILDLKLDSGKNYKVKLDDWMYLIDEKTLINKSSIKKFGITFGKLTIFFKKI